MLTSLNFLQPGQPWPPKSEVERLEMYAANRKLFENKHAEVYYQAFKRIERVISNFQDVVSYPVIINYQKLISLKVADLLLGESPTITAGKEGSPEQLTVDRIVSNNDLINTAYEAAIDVSRYGDGLFYVYTEEGKGQINVTQPPIWFPIVSSMNLKKILYHVLAWQYEVGTGDQKRIHLKVQIHEKGKYTEREYLLDGRTIQKQLAADNVIDTGLNDFAVIQVPNVITSERVHGMDDYTDIDSIVSELLVRIGQISRVLDKHASPSVQGPSSTLEKNPETGEWQLKMGNFFSRDTKEDPEVSYIVWDANMEANFRMIEQLVNFLHAISEMGSSLLGDKAEGDGEAPSGTSLRFRLISPLAKVKRIAMRFEPALIKAIKLCSQLSGEGIVDLTKVPISVTWNDGLPNDPKEEADIMSVRTGNKATMSVRRALITYDGMSEKDADNELELIEDEESKANPMSGQNAPFGGNNDPNTEDEGEGDGKTS